VPCSQNTRCSDHTQLRLKLKRDADGSTHRPVGSWPPPPMWRRPKPKQRLAPACTALGVACSALWACMSRRGVFICGVGCFVAAAAVPSGSRSNVQCVSRKPRHKKNRGHTICGWDMHAVQYTDIVAAPARKGGDVPADLRARNTIVLETLRHRLVAMPHGLRPAMSLPSPPGIRRGNWHGSVKLCKANMMRVHVCLCLFVSVSPSVSASASVSVSVL
jgi:hypothetical protein